MLYVFSPQLLVHRLLCNCPCHKNNSGTLSNPLISCLKNQNWPVQIVECILKKIQCEEAYSKEAYSKHSQRRSLSCFIRSTQEQAQYEAKLAFCYAAQQ